MQFPFLTPRVERLKSDGGVEWVRDAEALGHFRSPVILLARNLCTFSLFETAALPKGRRLQAARLHARTASPYVVSGSKLVRCGDDFGIWWWDLERIMPLLGGVAGRGRAALRPESLAQPRGMGWRIVHLALGYEGQYWTAEGLVASTWRADRFDAASWAAFTRLIRNADPAPSTPPPPLRLPISPASEAFALTATDISRNQALGLAAGSVGTALACLTLFVIGQGLGLRAETQRILAETEELRRATPNTGLTRGLESDRQRLAAYRQAEERTNPITAVGAAIGITAIYDITPTAVEVVDGVLTLTLPYVANRRSDDLIQEFEQSGYFFDIRPRTDATGQTLVIEMQIREAAPPLSVSG